MRHLNYLLTGIFLFTFIIVGCREDNSSPDLTTSHQHPQQTDKKWSFQLSEPKNDQIVYSVYNEKITDLKYGTDTFNLERVMITPDQHPLFISNNSSNDSINILKLNHHRKEDSSLMDEVREGRSLIGEIQTVTNTNVIQEINDFINGKEEDPILDSYTEIKNSGETTTLRISFYKASYIIKDRADLPEQLLNRFRNRRDTAYMMITDTTIAGNKQVSVNIAIASKPTPSYLTYTHQEPLYLSFQQPYEDFLRPSNLTGLMEGLNIEGLDPLAMTLDKKVEPNSITLTFNQTLNIDNKETPLQIEVTSNMESYYVNRPFLTLDDVKRAMNNTLDTGKDIVHWTTSFFSSLNPTPSPIDEYHNSGTEPTYPNIGDTHIETSQALQNHQNQRIEEEVDQMAFQVQTSPQNAIQEFEQRQNMPRATVTSPEVCDAIYDQEGLSDNYRDCAQAAAQAHQAD